MSGSAEHRSPAAAASVNKGSEKTATDAYARQWSSLPGYGLRWQPESALSIWFRTRVGAMGGRVRKIMIVALARKLLVALWRYVKDGVIPEGAKMRIPRHAGHCFRFDAGHHSEMKPDT
jgi:transposase